MKTPLALTRLLLALAGAALLVGAAKAAENPVSGVTLTAALDDARALASGRGDLTVVRVEGESMLPFFGNGAVLVVKTIPVEKLRAGMVVVYTNRFNETVAHRLVARAGEGWTAAGYNNAAADSTPVNAANLVGVVYATFHSNARPAEIASLAAATPVALAAPAR